MLACPSQEAESTVASGGFYEGDINYHMSGWWWQCVAATDHVCSHTGWPAIQYGWVCDGKLNLGHSLLCLLADGVPDNPSELVWVGGCIVFFSPSYLCRRVSQVHLTAVRSVSFLSLTHTHLSVPCTPPSPRNWPNNTSKERGVNDVSVQIRDCWSTDCMPYC